MCLLLLSASAFHTKNSHAVCAACDRGVKPLGAAGGKFKMGVDHRTVKPLAVTMQ
jgi:hypothetical protein